MRASKLLLSLVIVALTLSLAGCGRHESNEKYYLIAANIKLPYWQTAGAGLRAATGQMFVKNEFGGPDTYDPQAEAEEFRKAVAAKPSGILVSPADPEVMKPEIDAAIAAGIPVITIDSDAPGSKRLFFIGTNNYNAGTMGGKVAVKRLNGRGNVVFFSMPGQANLDERLHGYKDAFANSPGIKIVEVVNIKGDSRIAFDKTAEYLGKTGNNKIAAFICLEASAPKDVAEVVRREHATDRLVIGMDTEKETLDAIKDGTIAATITQKPYTMSYVGTKMLDDLHHNKLKSLNEDWAKDPRSPI
ncbi:MAG TPA: substrate-binding domain-containing protein, partial [Terriglobales bacterium]